MDRNYGMTIYGSGSSSFLDIPGTSIFSAIKNDILDLIYHGQYIRAKEKIALVALEAKKQEKLAYIQVLREIASSVTDLAASLPAKRPEDQAHCKL